MVVNKNNSIYHDRAGSYISQIEGYKAFIPKSLPPVPSIQFDKELLHLLSQADRELGRLDGASAILPDVDLVVAMYVNKEAVRSSQIEGTQASLIDVLAFEADAAFPENPQDIEEVINYIKALNYGLERLNALPLSRRLIYEIHSILLQGVRGANRTPGEFRTWQNYIGHPGGTIRTAKFIPPPPGVMNEALDDLEKFIHEDESLPPLIKVGLIHAQFETIHPFLDGNGRMGRLLITFILCSEDILHKPLLYLSHFFNAHKLEYYEYLQKIRDEGDWESWLKFFLQGVNTVAQEATATATDIVQLREKHRRIIGRYAARLAGASQLLEYLYKRPIITTTGVTNAIDLSYSNAKRLIQKFQELGLLRQMDTHKRNKRFIYTDYLALFADEDIDKGILKNERKAEPESNEDSTQFVAKED